MKTVIMSHRVKNYQEWKPYFDADKPRRTNAGLTELAVGTKSEDKQHVYMIFQTSDLQKSMKMMEQPDLQDTMKRAGVISEPEMVVID